MPAQRPEKFGPIQRREEIGRRPQHPALRETTTCFACWRRRVAEARMATPVVVEPSDDLVRWLCEAIARACLLAPGSVTAKSSVLDLGLDSLTLVSVLTQLEAAHGFELLPDDTLALLEAPSVGSLAIELAAIIPARVALDAPG